MAEFDPHPRFENHFCHFRPWSEHYKEAPGEMGVLARMLGYAWDEVERLRKSCHVIDKKHAVLLFAFIRLVETGVPRPFLDSDETLSIGEAWKSIQLLNEWRSKNKLNIKAVDT